MERCGKERPQYPSFSSTLLDVIYRSIDESDGGGKPYPFPAAAQQRPIPPSKERTLIRPRVLQPISTSSSSDNSSYGGFSSSSEPESAASRRARIRPIRTLPPPSRSAAAVSARPPPPPPPPRPTQRAPSPPAKHHRERTRSSSIRNKLRDLGRSKTPASPGSRLASLLNSLFANAAGKQRKPKPSPLTVDDSPCSAASTHSRPCLVKTPSSRRGPASDDEGFKRSVRFHPVSVVMGEEILPCSQKIACARDPAAAARLDDRRRPISVADGKQAREDARRKVEQMLRSLEVEEEEEDEMSDSSSDLFELENLTVRGGVGGGGVAGGGGYRDELPVYETTHLGNNPAFLAASSNKNY
ncbi:protein BIG GRAIN 1-like [Zingiber officinale]|uniref:Uncharacterized protein n=1 Tax=Zingiber officinale TaxID=94328 RepID=A0A8J5CVR5_ZINOF|nr:protein BIG GRAIN 1-like [Zingiber officinale]KAG6471791.1 hypothetical protein ZIOFF_069237 [Zingiber officinale]